MNNYKSIIFMQPKKFIQVKKPQWIQRLSDIRLVTLLDLS